MKTKIAKSCLLISLLVTVAVTEVKSQDSNPSAMYIDKVSIGLGIGIDNGGFGGSLLFYPIHQAGVFLGLGYPIAGFGYNAGVKFRLSSTTSTRRFIPYFSAMYGYNAAIAVSGASQYNKLFYGPSVAFGFDWKRDYYTKGYWSVGLFIPFRSSEVDDYMDDLRINHGVEFKNSLSPVGLSLAYRFIVS